MKKRKGKFTLEETIDILNETIIAGNYPDDGTGIAQDDDIPTGNIVYGQRYKQTKFFNRLNQFNRNWDIDNSDWKWDVFKHSIGMEDFDNYHGSLQAMKKLLPKEVWKNIWKHMKNVPDSKAIHPNQLGKHKEPYVEVDADKNVEIKNSKVKNKKLMKKLHNFSI